jgi:isocitrate dehydrogenase
MLTGGAMYETGAGGSAPRHVQQVIEENHLRWDSLGEFLAMTVSLEDMGTKQGNTKATILSKTLAETTTNLLQNSKSPSRRTGELDNRGSHFYLAMYWSETVAAQKQDAELAAKFVKLAKELSDNEANIIAELSAVQGHPTELGGYYHPDPERVEKIMRPSPTFNAALDNAMA